MIKMTPFTPEWFESNRIAGLASPYIGAVETVKHKAETLRQLKEKLRKLPVEYHKTFTAGYRAGINRHTQEKSLN